MNLVSAHIPAGWSAALWLTLAALCVLMARKATWRMLKSPANLNVFLGATVIVLGLWLIKTGIRPGLNFHLLGATALTLMFRPWFAILAIGLIVAGITLVNGQFDAYPANLLMMGVLPVSVSWTIYRYVDGRLPNHFFIYIFLNCFFGAGITIALVGIASTVFAATAGIYTLNYLLDNYLPFYLLMAWAEAFITGMIMTVLVVYRPDWVATFDDSRYLQSK
ncbi:MAG: energy-coupling factor ABC transporter permease [Gallionellaceae bacterium]|nr:energy-coupling factor ABC transporter permease [Gallionellaceae bacterium]MDD5364156.1 energy-coupling factor ABC transporter permease [Gallionellaceae bacterium]